MRLLLATKRHGDRPALEQVANPDLEGTGDPIENVDAHVAPPALDAAHIGDVKLSALSEGLLRPTTLKTQLTNALPELIAPGLRRSRIWHPSNMGVLTHRLHRR